MQYVVEGWWLGSLTKAGKLHRDTYLDLAAKVTVGFACCLAYAKAAKCYDREAAVRYAVAADNGSLACSIC